MAAPSSTRSGEDLVSELCEEFWEWRLRTNPEFASYCGVHKYDDQLETVTTKHFTELKRDVDGMVAKAGNIDAASISENSRLNLTLLQTELNTFLSGSEFKGWFFPINFMDSLQVDIDKIISFMTFKTEADYRTYNKRLKCYVQKLSQCIEVMEEGIKEKYTNHLVSMDKVPGQLKEIVSAELKIGSSVFLTPYVTPPEGIDKNVLDSLCTETINIVKGEVIPAFENMLKFLEDVYMKHLRPQIGVNSLSNGKAFYQQCLNFHLSLEMTPEEVHNIGLREVDRITKEMQRLSAEEGFGTDVMKFKKSLQGKEELYFTSGDDLVEGVKQICQHKIRPKLSQLFKKIPKSQLTVQPFPSLMSSGPVGFYMAGTVDGSRPGVYFINNRNHRGLPKYEVMALSLHEGEPGHHLQSMYAMEMVDVPKFRVNIEDLNYARAPTRFTIHTAYMEGWGLYCEYLGEELGLYEDNYSLFGRYCFEMMRAVRLVVDTGMHALGWTFDQSLEYMAEKTMMDRQHLNSECCRYVTLPGQACAYKIGELKIKELRSKASKALGEKFDVREFHDVVLRCGPVPLSVLKNQIDIFIKESQKS